jgi:hypothetical protein
MKTTPKLPKVLSRTQIDDFHSFLDNKYKQDCWFFGGSEDAVSEEELDKYEEFYTEPLKPTDEISLKTLCKGYPIIEVYEDERSSIFLYSRNTRRQLGEWWRSQHQ